MIPRMHKGFPLAVLVCVLAALLKIVWLHVTSGGHLGRVVFSDERSYYLPAARLILEQGFGFFFTPRSLWNGPLNPLWIAMWDANIALVKYANIALFSIGGLCLWETTRRLFNPAAGFLALGLYALHPPFFVFVPSALTEPLFVFFLLASLWAFAVGSADRNVAYVVSGMLMACAALTRPSVQLFPVFLLCLLLAVKLVHRKHFPACRNALPFRGVLCFFCGSCLLLLPYLFKNYCWLEKIGIANGAGAVLFLGSDLRTDGDEPVYSEMSFGAVGAITGPHRHLDTEGDRRLTVAWMENVKTYPLDYAWLTVRKLFRYLFGYPAYYFRPHDEIVPFVRHKGGQRVALVLVEMCLVVSVVVAGIWGLLSYAGGQAGLRLFVAGLVLYLVLLHTLTFPLPRYALPMFPFCLVFAAGFVIRSTSSRETRAKPRLFVAFSLVALIVSCICVAGLWQRKGTVPRSSLRYFSELRSIDIEKTASWHDVAVLEKGRLRSIRKDPYLVYRVSPFLAEANQMIFVELTVETTRGDTSGTGQLFWAAHLEEGFSEKMSKTFPLHCDGKSHIYRISPSLSPAWRGEIGALRLDFIDHAPGMAYRLSEIAVMK